MLQQYFAAKDRHPGVLLAMRVGDFYEFYGEDAETAAALLEITLTGREDGSNGRIAMAGVPFHAVEKYLAKLVKAGHKVAICDQVEDPRKAKGLVKREITRVLTSGTLLEDSMLQAGSNNFLAAVCIQGEKAGLATLDPSTGEFLVTEIDEARPGEKILQELSRLMPAELLYQEGAEEWAKLAREGLGINITEEAGLDSRKSNKTLNKQFDVSHLAGFGIAEKLNAIVAAAMVLNYAESRGLTLSHVNSLTYYSLDGFMHMDPSTRRSLELTQNLADGSRRNTLLSVLDATLTPMGSRMLRRWIDQPLLDIEAIQQRQGAIERIIGNYLARCEVRDQLKKLADMERLVSRCASGIASPRDVMSLKESLDVLPFLDDPVRKLAVGHIKTLRDKIDMHEDLRGILRKALSPNPPLTIRDGGIFLEGYDMELDKLRELSRNGKKYIAKLEAEEKEKTGLDKLKVGYNSVFGYHLEVPKSQIDRVPDHYIRKQTLANAERYITAELKEHESAVLGAEEKAAILEADLFERLRTKINSHAESILRASAGIAEIDVLVSLAETAASKGWTKPELVEEDVLEIDAGKHPVVEATTGGFVPNDLSLSREARLIVLTGPNMSGKSTYLRQAALLTLMAQIGSYVPAKSMKTGLCDRIFTRIGAKDEIALGQSTFMVEMIESANILNNASERSLVILDEVGRGTSTFDGLAIAWAMVEHLASIRSKTLFATHYHQLNRIAERSSVVVNYCVSVQEVGNKVIWTHKVLPGGTDKSYGLQVARMAGVPPEVVSRASQILKSLEEKDQDVEVKPSSDGMQLTLFEPEPNPMVEELKQLDVNQLTPMEALFKLDEWKKNLS